MLREAVLLSEIERKELMTLHRMLHLEESVAAQYSGGNEIFKHYREKANEQYVNYSELALPYEEHDSVKTVSASMNDGWVATYGDPNDPKVQAEIEASIAALKKGSDENGVFHME